MRLMFTCLGARLHPQCYGQYPNLSEGADRVGGQLRGDKECPFSGVTKSGRVWRKVPESGARSEVQRHKQGEEGCGGWRGGGGDGGMGGGRDCIAHCMGADREGPTPKIVQLKLCVAPVPRPLTTKTMT